MNNLKLFLSVAIVITMLFGCGRAPEIKNESNVELNGKWQLESVVQGNVVMKKPNVRQGIYDVSLTFKDKGELEATSANNYLTGFYETSQQNSIQLGGDGTERTETAWGDIFVNALPDVNFYDLGPNKLTLYYDHDNKLIFSRVGADGESLTASR
jgi:hypothetical protein